jgi:23S rRNA (cytosine1962-C5)-methyltransferase
MAFQELRLKPKADQRLRSGHLWVYSNEVASDLKQFQPGELANLVTASGKPLGTVTVNPHHLICGRIFSRAAGQPLSHKFIRHRLEAALHLRNQVFEQPYYRLVFGDSDGLPGLVVDRFGDSLVVQVSLAGMEQALPEIISALNVVVEPVTIVLKNDSKMRASEGLDNYVRIEKGSLLDGGLVELVENGTRFLAPVLTGQKTGWFYDHRLNRERMCHYARGKSVLDVCSYIGGWGVQAARAGAAKVVCLDTSAFALDLALQNAQLNGLAGRLSVLEGDAFAAMKALRDGGERFEMIILDPPAFIPRRKDYKAGKLAYGRLNQLALRLMSQQGILVSASCSMHLSQDDLLDTVRASGREIDRQVQILEIGHQGPDHPVHPAIAETQYIKSLLARVGPAEY